MRPGEPGGKCVVSRRCRWPRLPALPWRVSRRGQKHEGPASLRGPDSPSGCLSSLSATRDAAPTPHCIGLAIASTRPPWVTGAWAAWAAGVFHDRPTARIGLALPAGSVQAIPEGPPWLRLPIRRQQKTRPGPGFCDSCGTSHDGISVPEVAQGCQGHAPGFFQAANSLAIESTAS